MLPHRREQAVLGRDKREVHITGDGNVVGDGSSATVERTGGPE